MASGSKGKKPTLCKACKKPFKDSEEDPYWRETYKKHAQCVARESRYQEAEIPKRWWWKSFPVPTSDNKHAISVLKKLAKGNPDGRGVIFHGPVGVGKTYLLSIYAQALIDTGIPVVWWDVAKLFITLKNNFGKRYPYDEVTDNENIISKTIRTKYLFLDDLGREKSSDWTSEVLFHIINSRYESGINRIFLASNYSPLQLIERVGEPTISRLIEICDEPIKITGEDWRLRSIKGYQDG